MLWFRFWFWFLALVLALVLVLVLVLVSGFWFWFWFWFLVSGFVRGTADTDGAAPIAPSCGDRLYSLPAATAGIPPTVL